MKEKRKKIGFKVSEIWLTQQSFKAEVDDTVTNTTKTFKFNRCLACSDKAEIPALVTTLALMLVVNDHH